MGTISLSFRTHVPVGPIEDPYDYVTKQQGTILYTNDDGTRRIGSFATTRINFGLGLNHGESAFQICDTHSSWLVHVFYSLFNSRTGEFKNSIRNRFEPDDHDVLILDSIVLHPKFRRRGLGLMVARTIIDQLGAGCGITVAQMLPIAPGDADEHRIPRRWLPGVSDFCTATDAERKIAKHFGKMGFERVGRSGFFGLSMSLKRPTARDLERMRRQA